MDDTLNSTKQHNDIKHSHAETHSGSEAAEALIADIFAHLEAPDPAQRSTEAKKEAKTAAEEADKTVAENNIPDENASSPTTGKLARFASRKAPSSPAEPKVEREVTENDAAYDLKSLLEKLPSSAANGRVQRKTPEGVTKAQTETDKSSEEDAPSETAGVQNADKDKKDTPLKAAVPEPSSGDEPPSPSQEKTSYAPSRKTLVSDGTPSEPPAEDEAEAKDTPSDEHHADSDDDETDDEGMYEEDDLRPAIATPASEPIYDGRMLSQALVSSGRAFSHAVMHVGGTRQRAGRFWMIVIGMLILMALLVVLAHYKHREIKLGYELSNAISEREALLEENRKLRIELRVQSSRDRLEPMASRQLGLTQLRPEQILFIRQAEQPATPQEAVPSQRSDGLDRVKLLEDK